MILGAKEFLRRNNLPPILFESWGEWKEAEGVPAVQMRRDLFATLYDLGYSVVEVTGAPDMFLAVAHRHQRGASSGSHASGVTTTKETLSQRETKKCISPLR